MTNTLSLQLIALGLWQWYVSVREAGKETLSTNECFYFDTISTYFQKLLEMQDDTDRALFAKNNFSKAVTWMKDNNIDKSKTEVGYAKLICMLGAYHEYVEVLKSDNAYLIFSELFT